MFVYSIIRSESSQFVLFNDIIRTSYTFQILKQQQQRIKKKKTLKPNASENKSHKTMNLLHSSGSIIFFFILLLLFTPRIQLTNICIAFVYVLRAVFCYFLFCLCCCCFYFILISPACLLHLICIIGHLISLSLFLRYYCWLLLVFIILKEYQE